MTFYTCNEYYQKNQTVETLNKSAISCGMAVSFCCSAWQGLRRCGGGNTQAFLDDWLASFCYYFF